MLVLEKSKFLKKHTVFELTMFEFKIFKYVCFIGSLILHNSNYQGSVCKLYAFLQCDTTLDVGDTICRQHIYRIDSILNIRQ